MSAPTRQPWLARHVPIVGWARRYQRAWLRTDVAAGVTVSAVLIPSAMAHSQLAGLPPARGLYASFVALVLYAVFGTTRRLSVGTEATTAILTATAIAPLAAVQTPEKLATLAALLALFVGALCLLAGLCRLGWLSDLLSKPIITGYMMGAGLIIIGSQLGKLIGVKTSGTGFYGDVVGFLGDLPALHPLTTAIGAIALAFLFALSHFRPRWPSALIAMVAATVASTVWDWAGRGVAMVGPLAGGLPPLAWPATAMADVQALSQSAVSLSLLIFVSSILGARATAAADDPSLDGNRELLAYGVMNVGAALFQGLPVAGSDSRSAVNAGANARTQLSGLVAAGVLTAFLLFLAPVVQHLPLVLLAAVLVHAACGLIDPRETYRLFRVRWTEAGLALVTLVGVLLVGVVGGILLAAVLSIVELLGRLARPHDAVLADPADAEGYRPIRKGSQLQPIDGLVVYRFDSPLFFANTPYFLTRALHVIRLAAPPVRWFVLDAEAIATADATALSALETLETTLTKQGATLAVARANAPLRALLQRTPLGGRLARHVYPSVREAVEAFEADSRPQEDYSTDDNKTSKN